MEKIQSSGEYVAPEFKEIAFSPRIVLCQSGGSIEELVNGGEA